jgi:TRAP-type C4-dicarboxylate transport system permease large subunit
VPADRTCAAGRGHHIAHAAPQGVCLFVMCNRRRISIECLVRAVMPLLLIDIGILFLVGSFPLRAFLIPKLLGYL